MCTTIYVIGTYVHAYNNKSMLLNPIGDCIYYIIHILQNAYFKYSRRY